ncbi:MAG: F0F1 ATP synthase subunit A [Hyphomicrobiales bacterium]|nr:F0F1 ATP synthase subunit A [Hyphomicrobiales bacterium]
MHMNPDRVVFWQWSLGEWGELKINSTILFTWLVMAILVLGSRLITSRLSSGEHMSRWQNLLEVVVQGVRTQIRDMGEQETTRYLPFIGTLFVFIAVSNLLIIVPGYQPPTGSLSTTTALAISVLLAVPIYGIAERGVSGYLRRYLQPTLFMLPFNIIGEISRTIALAIRLYGNVMSGTVIVGILISVAPFLFPILIELLGLLTGLIQAYIFAVLAMVYIASATRAHPGEPQVAGNDAIPVPGQDTEENKK